MVIQVYVVKKETEPPRRKGGPAPHGLFRINSTTDVAQALGETSMSQETTPAQFQANVKNAAADAETFAEKRLHQIKVLFSAILQRV